MGLVGRSRSADWSESSLWGFRLRCTFTERALGTLEHSTLEENYMYKCGTSGGSLGTAVGRGF